MTLTVLDYYAPPLFISYLVKALDYIKKVIQICQKQVTLDNHVEFVKSGLKP